VELTVNEQQAKDIPRFYVSSLGLISANYTARCDAKIADIEFIETMARVRAAGCFELGDVLPQPFVKGVQLDYLDLPTDDSVPVINTLSIQNLSVRLGDCRHVSKEQFEAIAEERRPRRGDVLLTVDGGVSIGKTALFDWGEEFAIDSHVVILRPAQITPLSLVYLLASPLGQMQFRYAESGASGQTTVTEDDVNRRRHIPRASLWRRSC
jgi:hypothetical protein